MNRMKRWLKGGEFHEKVLEKRIHAGVLSVHNYALIYLKFWKSLTQGCQKVSHFMEVQIVTSTFMIVKLTFERLISKVS